jgi:hypothetical protein
VGGTNAKIILEGERYIFLQNSISYVLYNEHSSEKPLKRAFWWCVYCCRTQFLKSYNLKKQLFSGGSEKFNGGVGE